LNARQLAKETGSSETVISRARTGKVKPRPKTIQKIAEYLSRSPVLPGADLVLGEID
jgi:predicted transcriptional regulator